MTLPDVLYYNTERERKINNKYLSNNVVFQLNIIYCIVEIRRR
jgi:hypothetical protein